MSFQISLLTVSPSLSKTHNTVVCSKTHTRSTCSHLYAVDHHFSLAHTCLNNSLNAFNSVTDKYFTQTLRPPPYLQQTGPAETPGSTHTPATSFWLPGAFSTSAPAIYTALAEGQRACQWRRGTATAPISANACLNSHLVQSEKLGAERNRKLLVG